MIENFTSGMIREISRFLASMVGMIFYHVLAIICLVCSSYIPSVCDGTKIVDSGFFLLNMNGYDFGKAPCLSFDTG